MKKILSLLTLASVFIVAMNACKKNNSAANGPEIVITKISVDDVLVEEREYSADKKLHKVYYYDETDGKLQSSKEFDYDGDGSLKSINFYNAAGTLQLLEEFTIDAQGKIISKNVVGAVGAEAGKVISHSKFTYNAAGRISEITFYEKHNSTDPLQKEVFTYYANGNLKMVEYYNQVTPSMNLGERTEYTPQGKPLPQSLIKHRGHPDVYNFLPTLTAEKINYKAFIGLGVGTETENVCSNRQVNENGFITAQTITTHQIIPVLADIVISMKYEYTEL